MTMDVQPIDAALDALAAAIQAADAAAIHAASAALAVAVQRMDGGDADALATVLARLEALSITVNLHNSWTRQRLDSLNELRAGRGLTGHRYC